MPKKHFFVSRQEFEARPKSHCSGQNGERSWSSKIKEGELPVNWTVSEIFGVVRKHYGLPMDSNPIWFRGEAKSYDTILTPKLFRGFVDREKSMYNTYLFQYHDKVKLKTLDNLADMQHFGLPTRLLDWSTSMLVALFFACSGHKGEDGFLFILEPCTLTNRSFRLTLFESDLFEIYSRDDKILKKHLKVIEGDEGTSGEQVLPVAVMIPRANPRIQAQMGCFTLHGGSKFTDSQLLPGETCEVLKIPAGSKESLLLELKYYGISEMTLFPDDISKLNY